MEEKVTSIFGADAMPAMNTFSPLPVAYMGDAVYEMFVRTRVVSMGNMPVKKLNKLGNELSMARTQARMVALLKDDGFLSDDELHLIQRGKNSKVGTVPKSATAAEYHYATAFEYLLGYLYMTDHTERASQIVRRGWELLVAGSDSTEN